MSEFRGNDLYQEKFIELVLKELERLDKKVDKVDDKQDIISKGLTVLNTKSAFLGTIGGLVGGGIITLIAGIILWLLKVR